VTRTETVPLSGQAIGLTQFRLSRLERESEDHSQADADMKKAQKELAALGWKNVSGAHSIGLTTQLNSEYKHVDQKNTAVAAHQDFQSAGHH
jgi:hypothetical protein